MADELYYCEDYSNIENMNRKITIIVKELFSKHNKNENWFERTFIDIYYYIKEYKRIMYSPITSAVYDYYEKHEENDDVLFNNLEFLVEYAFDEQSNMVVKGRLGAEVSEAIFDDTKKAILKISDHINLANSQYLILKQSDDEYKEKFERLIAEQKTIISKEMSSQLITMVAIFTALAFILFGGISSLDNVFSSPNTSILRIVILTCAWGLGIINMVFVFLFCVAQMTKLSLVSPGRENEGIFAKYPVFWWADYILFSTLILSFWLYYIRGNLLSNWFPVVFQPPYLWVTLAVLAFIIFGLYFLIKKTGIKTTNNEEQ